MSKSTLRRKENNMQTLKMRQGNCRRTAQVNQAVNCTLTYQRIRCCGQVLSEQEITLLTENKQGRGRGKRQRIASVQGTDNNNGQGQCMSNRQGRGQGKNKANNQNNS